MSHRSWHYVQQIARLMTMFWKCYLMRIVLSCSQSTVSSPMLCRLPAPLPIFSGPFSYADVFSSLWEILTQTTFHRDQRSRQDNARAQICRQIDVGRSSGTATPYSSVREATHSRLLQQRSKDIYALIALCEILASM